VALLLAGKASTLVDDGKSLFLWGDELDSVGKNITCSMLTRKFATMIMILKSTKLIFKIMSHLFNSLQSECVFPTLQ